MMEVTASDIQGLNEKEAAELREKYGRNVLPQVKRNRLKEWLARFTSPISLMLIAASALSFYLGKIFDGWFIIALFAINLGITFWHERKADHALEVLEQEVSVMVKTLRDSVWKRIDSRELVPGDVVELAGGSVVPADGKTLSVAHASVNESALTGESLPIDKKEGDDLSMGSYMASGVARMQVTATGAMTRFGSVIASGSGPRQQSALEKDILTISKFLSGIAVAVTVVLSIALIVSGQPILEIIRLDLTLLIAGVPVALPVVMSVIISVGVLRLSEHAAIVRRLAALEDLANVDMLLSDKTGTLTKNEITVESITIFDGHSEMSAAGLASATATVSEHSTLEAAIVAFAKAKDAPIYTANEFIPADSVRKRSTVLADVDGVPTRITLGAAQVVESLVSFGATDRAMYEEAITNAGDRGYRTLALAIKKGTPGGTAPEEKDMEMVAIFLLSDELRDDAAEVITFLNENGVAVKMLTGDNIAVSREIAHKLGLPGEVYHCNMIKDLAEDTFEGVGVFAEVLPEDKETLVRLAEQKHTVAVTGDGVNDLPAVRAGNVGIAVKNAVDALKAVADIVLIQNGIGVIKEAIIESRQIFTRIYSYSIYRISESFRVIITVAFFGILFFAPVLTPLQLLLLALLNDLPIISLAFNRVRTSHKPAVIDVKRRFTLSLLYGSVGILNSIIFFFLARDFWHLDWNIIQTLFFLKLTVSGHMLVFVAHTHKRWWQFLPSKVVVLATISTQIVATVIALIGIFMTAAPVWAIAFVWVWSFMWMQISDAMKVLREKLEKHPQGVMPTMQH